MAAITPSNPSISSFISSHRSCNFAVRSFRSGTFSRLNVAPPKEKSVVLVKDVGVASLVSSFDLETDGDVVFAASDPEVVTFVDSLDEASRDSWTSLVAWASRSRSLREQRIFDTAREPPPAPPSPGSDSGL